MHLHLDNDDRILLNKYREVNGDERICRAAMEECGELIVATSHYFRKSKVVSERSLAGECADVVICIAQLVYSYTDKDIPLFERALEYKLGRERARLR